MENSNYLELDANIGLNCISKNCLVIHPSETYMMYAIGSLIIVKAVSDDKDQYLRGHTGIVNCLAVSSQGNLLASGEAHDFSSEEAAALIVWDFNSLQILFRVRYHKQMIQSLSFSCDEAYLVTVGGARDGNQLVIWNMREGKSEAFMPSSDQ